ncbi:MAG: hypothetical protein HY606_04475 [Planctomycetes bacterium]|nr:hypothetical protein [Planctomycetota bacterium]
MKFASIICLFLFLSSCGEGESSNPNKEVYDRLMEKNEEMLKQAKKKGELDLKPIIEIFNKLKVSHEIYNSVEQNKLLLDNVVNTLKELDKIGSERLEATVKIERVEQLCLRCHEIFLKE